MDVTITKVQETATFEAGAVLSELALKVLIARANGTRPKESLGKTAIRGAVRADFVGRITLAMRAEEQSVIQTGEGIEKLKGESLSALGTGLGVQRTGEESDPDYRIRLHAANDLESKPIRSQVRDAAEAMVSSLLGPGPVADLLAVSIAALED